MDDIICVLMTAESYFIRAVKKVVSHENDINLNRLNPIIIKTWQEKFNTTTMYIFVSDCLGMFLWFYIIGALSQISLCVRKNTHCRIVTMHDACNWGISSGKCTQERCQLQHHEQWLRSYQ